MNVNSVTATRVNKMTHCVVNEFSLIQILKYYRII